MLERIVLLLAAASVAACSHDVVHVDEGRVCLRGPGADGELVPGLPGTIEVTSPCASACAENLATGCGGIVAGDQIVVESHFAYDVAPGACIALCAAYQATCELPALAAGTYTLRHGADQARFVLGSATGPICMQ